MIDINKILNSDRIEVSFAEINVNAHYVKNFRKRFNLTQIELANIIGESLKTVSDWESGRLEITGSGSILIYLLNNNPDLISQLYTKEIKR